MNNHIAVANPPDGFDFDPAPDGIIPQEDRLRPFPALTPMAIGISLEEATNGRGQSPRILQAKSGLDQRLQAPKAV